MLFEQYEINEIIVTCMIWNWDCVLMLKQHKLL